MKSLPYALALLILSLAPTHADTRRGKPPPLHVRLAGSWRSIDIPRYTMRILPQDERRGRVTLFFKNGVENHLGTFLPPDRLRLTPLGVTYTVRLKGKDNSLTLMQENGLQSQFLQVRKRG